MSVVTYSTTVSTNPSSQLQIALKVVEAGAVSNVKEIAALTTDDYVHIWLPEKGGLPKESKEAYLTRVGKVAGRFAAFVVSVASMTLRC